MFPAIASKRNFYYTCLFSVNKGHATECGCGNQGITFRSEFSPSIAWNPGIKRRWVAWKKVLYPLSQISGLQILLFKQILHYSQTGVRLALIIKQNKRIREGHIDEVGVYFNTPYIVSFQLLNYTQLYFSFELNSNIYIYMYSIFHILIILPFMDNQ